MTLLPAKNYPINCGLASSIFNRSFQKKSISERSFDITATESKRIIAYASQSIISRDKDGGTTGTPLKTFLVNTEATYATDFIVSLQILQENYFQPITLSSESPNILVSPSISGIATYVSDGPCILKAQSLDGETSLIKVQSSSSNNTVETFQSWASGSLAHHCTNQIDTLIANKTALNVFTTTNWSARPATFIRNSDCWANGIDLSCASPWNNENGSLYAGTLISPRHVVFCDHASFYPKNGKTITFVSPSNQEVTRTIVNSVRAGDPDIRVALLDSDVPNSITFAKVLPSNWATYLIGFTPQSTVPVMCLNQTERASIASLRSLHSSFLNAYPTLYPSYYGEIILFDSGNPTFLIINGQLVLIGVFTGGGAGNGSFISYHMDAVNAAMTSLGGGYQLSTINLSQFLTY